MGVTFIYKQQCKRSALLITFISILQPANDAASRSYYYEVHGTLRRILYESPRLPIPNLDNLYSFFVTHVGRTVGFNDGKRITFIYTTVIKRSTLITFVSSVASKQSSTYRNCCGTHVILCRILCRSQWLPDPNTCNLYRIFCTGWCIYCCM